MLKQFTIYLGLNDKDTKKQEVTTIDAYKILMNLLDGATINESTGFYKHNNGDLIIEKSLQIILIDFNNNLKINDICDQLKKLFNQEAVVLQETFINSKMI